MEALFQLGQTGHPHGRQDSLLLVLRTLVVVDVMLELRFLIGELGEALLHLGEGAQPQTRQHPLLLLLCALVVVQAFLEFFLSHPGALRR